MSFGLVLSHSKMEHCFKDFIDGLNLGAHSPVDNKKMNIDA
jgi:hypothetical protein